MKTTSKFFIKTFLILSLSSFVMSSCSDDDSSSIESSVSDEEVQEILKSSLVYEGGIVVDLQTTAESLNNNTAGRSNEQNATMAMDLSAVNCNQTVSNSFENSNTVGSRSWSVQTNWTWTLNCDAQNNSVSFDSEANGSLEFDGPNLSKDMLRTHEFFITGIEPSSTEWVYNANHTRDGFIQSNVGNQNSMNTLLIYGSTDIVVSKSTQQIVSGTFDVDFSATLPNGNIVTRGATVVFNGNQTATITLDNGVSFDVSW
ncbi:hypothetical protein [Mesohalobacter halotolerans]|uniref:Lipoprotein n=1 Tax=Mesohalobacter halotolerans TaxID=1883405 RepID=A0A4U5TRZ8_9FLAO|nr:hypothetical protein [Mesohalobacter halotolerans]MBS3738450.1 hypothetical protein [Psychroflexus sp.]TKS56873.1 hypothetical protein FCN74_00155 [Mesohalobacter halotolerans]